MYNMLFLIIHVFFDTCIVYSIIIIIIIIIIIAKALYV